MQIQGNSIYAPLIGKSSANKGVATLRASLTAPTSINETAPLSSSTSSNAVRGTTTGLLSSTSQSAVIHQGQESDSGAAETGDTSGLSIAAQHEMDAIANDPEIAKQYAGIMAYGADLQEVHAAVNDPSLTPEQRATQSMEQLKNTKALEQQTHAVQQQRQSIYDAGKASGKSSAETYADMLKFNANLPESYGNALMPNSPPGTWTSMQKDQLAYLEQAMSQAKGAQS